MVSSSVSRQICVAQRILLVLLFLCVTGCSEPSGKKSGDAPVIRGSKAKHENAQANSVSALLIDGDYEKFRPGRSKSDILNDIQWRGNFEQAATYKGKSVSVISYGILGGPLSDHGTSVLAIFVDEKFDKFVRWPAGVAKIKVGDFGILIRAAENDLVNISDIEEEMKKSEVPRQTDPGLTAVWLVLRGGIQAARAPALKKNAALRDQFNAARLKLGMTESEVEAVLKAKPIDSGEVEAGTFKIYGSNELSDITFDLHYSNILVVLKEGHVIGIYSGWMVHGGAQLQELRRLFVDLPVRGGVHEKGRRD